MDSDLLLTWMSTVGRGSIRELRMRAAWLARTSGRVVHSSATGRWLRDMSALGHVELDWLGDTWSIGPSAVTRLPESDGLAVLCGRRLPDQIDAIERLEASTMCVRTDAAPTDLAVASTIVIQYDRVDQLQTLAAESRSVYVGCAARRLSARLPAIAVGPASAPPALQNDTLERLRLDDELRFERIDRWTEDGLYRLQINGRMVHRYVTSGAWFHSDLAGGTFLALNARGKSAMRWRREPDAPDDGVGTVFIDFGAPLPPLQARALTLCSGFPARFSTNAQTAIYGNVPREIAMRVGQSLAQRILVI